MAKRATTKALRGSSTDESAAGGKAKKRGGPKEDFHKQTVLFQWGLSQFGVSTLEEFKKRYDIDPDSPAGLDATTGLHRFFEQIVARLPLAEGGLGGGGRRASVDRLRMYEQNILGHTQRVNAARVQSGQPRIDWLYHQYLALVFTEMYLDRYFADAAGLRSEINEQIQVHNESADQVNRVVLIPTEPTNGVDGDGKVRRDDADPKRQLARLAFWCATGSGKTLLMHINLRQFMHYHQQAVAAGRWPVLDQVILVTPNDGLTVQHKAEFEQSGFSVVTMQDQGANQLFQEDARKAIKILSIHKFKDDHGESTVATEAFAGHNLILVDEGHRGMSGGDEGEWLKRRDELAKDGFCIEYSATFKEAIGDSEELKRRYAHSVLFDYAYRSFYRDGYGKDFTILNLEDDKQQEQYLTAALLLFYQQMRVWLDGGEAMRPFLIDRPLWVFVGHTVTGGKAKAKTTADKVSESDVVEVLRFLHRFVSREGESKKMIRGLLNEEFVGSKGQNLLADRLPHINIDGDKSKLADTLYKDILKEVFHASGSAGLCVQLRRGGVGELALKVGDAEPFGVVNVGDPGGVAQACVDQKTGITKLEDDLGRDSLFSSINRNDSKVNMLVGSRKFTEGWNSWRVSSIGLMHMGKSEGTQIIQLFGRGVRLRGYQMSLRRSSSLKNKPQPPRNLRQVETLHVFGVQADYLNQFKQWIADEVPGALERRVWKLPVIETMPDKRLKTLRLRQVIDGVRVEGGSAFKQLGPLVRLRVPRKEKEDSWLIQSPVTLNWLPRIQGVQGASGKIEGVSGDGAALPTQSLKAIPMFMFDLDDLVFTLEEMKAMHGLDRLHVDRQAVKELLQRDDWYVLHALAGDMRLDRYENRVQWQLMAQQLLKQYAMRLYKHERQRWEAPFIEVVDLASDDESMLKEYEVASTDLVRDESDLDQIESLVEDLRKAIKARNIEEWSQWQGHWRSVYFRGHVYQPLLHVGKNQKITLRPVALDEHESQFVTDLATWCTKAKRADVYLLRNQAVKGLGFFQAGNFFPDFLLWVVSDEMQHVVFIDPKGLVMHDQRDLKIRFATEMVPSLQRVIERKTKGVRLHAFTVATTPYSKTDWLGEDGRPISKEQIERLAVLFMKDDPTTYIQSMMAKIAG